MKDILISLTEELLQISKSFDPYSFRDEFNDDQEAFEYLQGIIMDDPENAIEYLDYISYDDEYIEQATALKGKILAFTH